MRPPPRRRFLSLLIALLGLFILGSLIDMPIGQAALFIWVLASAIFIAGTQRERWVAGIALMLPTSAIVIANAFTDATAVVVAFHIIVLVFIAYTCAIVLRYVVSASQVTFDLINASLCVYLLLGLFWAVLFSFVDTIATVVGDPAFHVADTAKGSVALGGAAKNLSLYFSLVTLTTLGYGEITPIWPIARILAAVEAVVGPLYLTVLVARLVGMQVSQANSASRPK